MIAGAPALPEATQAMRIFYLLQFGKHFSRLFSHMFIKQEGNYYEYVLHHSLSTFLILFSYLTNQWLIGIMVLLCHDISDFFLIIGRGYKVFSENNSGLQKLFSSVHQDYLCFCYGQLDSRSAHSFSCLLCVCKPHGAYNCIVSIHRS